MDIAAYAAGLNHLADDEADIATYGDGLAWVAQ
jgi:hypothetical protein